MSVRSIKNREACRSNQVEFAANLEDSIYIFEPRFGKILEYTVVAIFCDKDGVTYSLDAYADNENLLIYYKTLDQNQIGKTAFLSREQAEANLAIK